VYHPLTFLALSCQHDVFRVKKRRRKEAVGRSEKIKTI
jgi:hypothetical protein